MENAILNLFFLRFSNSIVINFILTDTFPFLVLMFVNELKFKTSFVPLFWENDVHRCTQNIIKWYFLFYCPVLR